MDLLEEDGQSHHKSLTVSLGGKPGLSTLALAAEKINQKSI